MTSQLQTFHQDTIQVEVVQKELRDTSLNREVILRRQRDLIPVEYGAIQIYYSQLPPEARKMVLDCTKPPGAILHECAVDFRSCPGGFFRLESDEVMNQAFVLERMYFLYGRCNLLTYANGKILANVVKSYSDRTNERIEESRGIWTINMMC